MNLQARAQMVEPEYKSRYEEQYAEVLELRKLAGEIYSYRYEPMKLRLGKSWKTSYQPDFLTVGNDGAMTFIEVKGFWMPAARVKTKTAALLFPEFRFIAVTKDKNQPGWAEEVFYSRF